MHGPIPICHRTVVQVSCVQSGCARNVLVVSWQTVPEFTLIKIIQYELGCIGRTKRQVYVCRLNVLVGSIHVGSGVYVNNRHKELWKFAGEMK